MKWRCNGCGTYNSAEYSDDMLCPSCARHLRADRLDPRLQQLYLNDPIVHACLRHYIGGSGNLVEALTEIVCAKSALYSACVAAKLGDTIRVNVVGTVPESCDKCMTERQPDGTVLTYLCQECSNKSL